VLNIPLSDIARFRIGVDHQERDGYVHNNTGIGPSDFNDINYTAARASLVVDLTPDLENYTIVTYTRSDTNGDITKLTNASPTSLLGILGSAQLAREAGTGFYTAQNDEPNPRTLLTTWRAINTTTWRASDALTVKNIASYAELRESFLSSLFGTDLDLHDAAPLLGPLAALVPPGSKILFAESAPYAGHDTAAQSTFTDELQFQGNAMENKLNYQFGGYIEASDPLASSGSQSPLFANCADAADFMCANPIGAASINYTVAQTKTRNYGIYAQGTYAITDQLKLTGGIRYTWDRESDFSFLRGYNFAPFNPFQAPAINYKCNDGQRFPGIFPVTDNDSCRNTLKEKAEKPTWLIDLDYKPSDDILIYAKWARGFRAGGLVPQAPSGIDATGAQVGTNFQTYAPEKVDDFEIGLKSQFRGPVPVTFNINGFYNNFSNQQLLSSLLPDTAAGSNAGVASGIINAGKSKIYGVEVEATISPFAGFTLDGSYTYLHAELRQVNAVSGCDGTYCVSFPALAGDPLPLAPKNKFSITGSYTLPVDPGIGRITFSATETYRSRYLTNYIDKNTPGLPPEAAALSYEKAVALLNLNVNWTGIAGSPVDLSLFATNVLGEHYFTGESGLFSAVQFETQSYGEPRMFGARLKFHFGG
jgi:iron complex outermembrane recepter protein